jgi:hypothetical protein
VQEFQVLTQNYKAEHEKASSLVITAVTKSAGNRWSGEGFLFYQNKNLVEKEYFAKLRGDPKPTYDRFQPGVSIGGPIIKDRAQMFASYEENRQDRASRVFLGSTPIPESLAQMLRPYEGTFTSPFREKLFFGKVTSQPVAASRSISATARDMKPTSAASVTRRASRRRRTSAIESTRWSADTSRPRAMR